MHEEVTHRPPTNLRQSWPSPSRPRDIVIFGAGGIVNDSHLPAYNARGLPVRGLYDIDPSRARDTAAQEAQDQHSPRAQVIGGPARERRAEPEQEVEDEADGDGVLEREPEVARHRDRDRGKDQLPGVRGRVTGSGQPQDAARVLHGARISLSSLRPRAACG